MGRNEEKGQGSKMRKMGGKALLPDDAHKN
jgi:hypothetical protein